MSIDRAIFFSSARAHPFGGAMTQEQVDGCNVILDEWEKRQLTDLRWLAYILGTAFHETATRMEPVIETRQPREATNPSVDVAIARLEHAWAAGHLPWVKNPYWRKDANGLSWLVTHRSRISLIISGPKKIPVFFSPRIPI